MKAHVLICAMTGLLAAGCSQSVALGVSAGFRDSTGAVVYTGGGGASEINAATPPLSGLVSISAFVNGDGADPIQVEGVAVNALVVTVPSGSVCTARTESCAAGVCTATTTWSALGACAFDVVADTAEGEVSQCVSFALALAGSGDYQAALDKAASLCGE